MIPLAKWDDFCAKQCHGCKKPLIDDNPRDIIFDGDSWMHFSCHQRALHAFAIASKIAKWSFAIQEYIICRDTL